MKLSIIIISVVLFTGLSAQSDDKFTLDINTRNYDQQHIKLNLSFDFERSTIMGRAEIKFAALTEKFNTLILHAKNMHIESVVLAEEELKFQTDDELLFIKMDKDYDKNSVLTVAIDYNTKPAKGMYFFSPSDSIPFMPYQIWTQGQGEDNRYWYPSYDKPDDRFTSEIIATVPGHLGAYANGNLISESTNLDGTKTFHWMMDDDHPGYLTSFIAGDFQIYTDTVRNTALEYYIPRDVSTDYNLVFGRTPLMFNFFSDYIHPYPYKRFAQIPVQDYVYGGMENITQVTLNRRIFNLENAGLNYTPDDLLAHEFAHQWFGDMLTCNEWKDIWLNEGFATYFTNLYTEDAEGENKFRYDMHNAYRGLIIYNPQEHIATLKLNKENLEPLVFQHRDAYQKGASVLHMLRYELGDDIFKKGIQKYVTTYLSRNVSTEKFKSVMEEVSGVDLTKFFDQWVYGAGYPILKVKYKWDNKNNLLIVHINQVQQSFPAVGLFHFPLEIEFTNESGLHSYKVRVDKKENTFSFECDSEPLLVRIDRDGWILKKLIFEKSLPELEYQLFYDNSVNGRMEAAEEIIKFGTDAVHALRNAALRDKFFGVRLKAVESLSRIECEESYNALMLLINDGDSRIREKAITGLGNLQPYLNLFPELKSIFECDNNDYVRGAAMLTIGRHKYEGAYDYMTSGLIYESHRNIIRRNIFEGLTELGDASALPFAKEYLKYQNSFGGMHLLDIAALNYAGSFGKNPEAINVIASALNNPYFRTRNYAANLLVKLGANEKLPLLREIYENEHREIVKPTLRKAIEKLNAVYEE
ncbi:MAG: HEAT repeat domain-containing protein [Melioribacteraceae bacterium]|nr:HEAT repeat domain-containing protein [Melioribacteraceae bacterium]MCF8353553.1 HEAT repeat domain-containing protein [Melioribacteraceae bacterium]MCF8392513.1 HEAT repeat domain-containing protein [Melioribacteraceae bacterium]